MGWFPCNCGPDCRLISTFNCPDNTEAKIYHITVSSFANSDCLSCSTWNGTFDLKWKGDGGTILWESDSYAGTECGHTANDPLWRLEYSSFSHDYTLTAVGLGYTWSTLSWDCACQNTLELDPVAMMPDPCTGYPASITVKPCIFVECDLCDGNTPSSISVTIAGLADDDCACSLMNATYILERTCGCYWGYVGPVACSHSCAAQLQIIAYRYRHPVSPNPLMWFVEITLTLNDACTPPGVVAQQIWTCSCDTGVDPIDCSASYDLVFRTTTRTLSDYDWLCSTPFPPPDDLISVRVN